MGKIVFPLMVSILLTTVSGLAFAQGEGSVTGDRLPLEDQRFNGTFEHGWSGGYVYYLEFDGTNRVAARLERHIVTRFENSVERDFEIIYEIEVGEGKLRMRAVDSRWGWSDWLFFLFEDDDNTLVIDDGGFAVEWAGEYKRVTKS